MQFLLHIACSPQTFLFSAHSGGKACPQALCDLIIQCLDRNPDARPTAGTLTSAADCDSVTVTICSKREICMHLDVPDCKSHACHALAFWQASWWHCSAGRSTSCRSRCGLAPTPGRRLASRWASPNVICPCTHHGCPWLHTPWFRPWLPVHTPWFALPDQSMQ